VRESARGRAYKCGLKRRPWASAVPFRTEDGFLCARFQPRVAPATSSRRRVALVNARGGCQRIQNESKVPSTACRRRRRGESARNVFGSRGNSKIRFASANTATIAASRESIGRSTGVKMSVCAFPSRVPNGSMSSERHEFLACSRLVTA